ncbi:MAG: zinc transporter ZupT [Eubacteriales bacterium]
MSQYIIPLFLTLMAGLCTGIGSLFAFFVKGEQKKFLSYCLGFSAGVMIYVSMIEIFQKGWVALAVIYGEKQGLLMTMVGFFSGMFFISFVDNLIPQVPQTELSPDGDKEKMLRSGLFTALAIGLHNFPEGLATFVSALQDPQVAIPIVVAIAIHNIPEGIAVSVPIYYATGDKKKALFYSFLSGLSEPIGAIVGFSLLLPFMNDAVYGALFAFVAGIMVFISMDELLPSARNHGHENLSIWGAVSGMMLMGVSLWLFL